MRYTHPYFDRIEDPFGRRPRKAYDSLSQEMDPQEKLYGNATLGLPRGEVRLLPYQAQWCVIYAAEEARLKTAIGSYILDIQHIGSTSIPGMAAKPIIDIGVALESYQIGFDCVKPLEAIGYIYKGENEIPGRHYFNYREPSIIHLHMYAATHPEWQAHLLFRDYLRRHVDTARQYASLKQQLAERYRYERERYTHAKSEFIQKVIVLAQEELANLHEN